jgi:hypothetical protein
MADPTIIERAMAIYAQIQSPVAWADLTPEQQAAWIAKANFTSTSATFIAG